MVTESSVNSSVFGAEYKDMSSVQYCAAMQEIENIASSEFALEILDIGCGDGKVTAEIAKKFPASHITGMDISSELIALAQGNFNNSKLDFIQEDATKIFEHQKYDVIFSFFCLHLIEEDKLIDTINRIFKSLKSGGQLHISIPARDPILYQIRTKVMENFKEELNSFTLLDRGAPEQYLSLLRKMSKFYNFNIHKETIIDYNPNLSIDEFKNFFSGISRERRMLKSEASKNAYVEKVAQLMPKRNNLHINYLFKFVSIYYDNIFSKYND